MHFLINLVHYCRSSLLAILRRLIDDQENIKAASERCAARFGAEEDGMAQATVRTVRQPEQH